MQSGFLYVKYIKRVNSVIIGFNCITLHFFHMTIFAILFTSNFNQNAKDHFTFLNCYFFSNFI